MPGQLTLESTANFRVLGGASETSDHRLPSHCCTNISVGDESLDEEPTAKQRVAFAHDTLSRSFAISPTRMSALGVIDHAVPFQCSIRVR